MSPKKFFTPLFIIFIFLYFYIFILSPVALAENNAPIGVALPNPLPTTDIRLIVGNIIKMLTGGAGAIALMIFIYGGFLWLTSMGNSERIKKGKDILLWATLGMVIMFGSYIIVNYIITAITTGTATP